MSKNLGECVAGYIYNIDSKISVLFSECFLYNIIAYIPVSGSMGNIVYECIHKYTIDDVGTLSENGYAGEDFDKIEKEINYLLTTILKREL